LYLNDLDKESEWYEDFVMKILTNFKNLKILLIYIDRTTSISIDLSCEAKFRKLLEYLDMNEIMKNYKVKYFCEYTLFLKREFNDIEVEDVTFFNLIKSSFFSRLIRLFF
jgi:hypothetical protein